MPALHPVVINEVLTKQVAIQTLAGSSIRTIASDLGIGDSQVRRIQASDKFKEVLKDIGDDAVTQAKQTIRAETSKLAKEVLRVLNAQLEDNSLEAVKIALKVLGVEQLEDTGKGDTTISVIMPGSAPAKDIEAHYEHTNVPEGGEGQTE